jgi:four helix bundle protein
MRGVLEEKSFNFAIRVVKLNRYLTEIKHEYVISKQLLRSGTSIGANISEAQFAQSKSDFGTKMHISLKEANETRYWVRLLTATDYLTKDESESLISDCNELISLLSSTCKTVLPRTHEE